MREGADRDVVLQAVGRTLSGKKIAAGIAGVTVTDRGFINVDIQMRTNVPHIFAIGEIALAIEMGADYVDLGKTIHPHPRLGESIGMAAEIAHGSCTDVPPVRK
jgi:pyruvate/2-oxoglutarate dehydrogenase complex dihydrolipoamide dehydrogenase (E3) component